MEENLVGYLCNALDEDTHKTVEDFLRDNPEAQGKLELLRRALEPLAADREEPEPPAGLVVRTLAHIAEHRCTHLPAAPAIAGKVGGYQRSWWRRADVLVAACLLIAIMGVGLNGLMVARRQSQITECAGNLALFHHALMSYADRHEGRFPSPADHPEPYNVAGMVVPALMEDLPPGQQPAYSVRCPANGGPRLPEWSLKELRTLQHDEFNRRAPRLGGCYAYSLGYRDEMGKIHGLGREDNSYLPLMGDRPPEGGAGGNSPNHGTGQNVLHINGQVDYYDRRDKPGDDIYLNQANRVGAGLHPRDIVLGSSADRP